MEPQSTVPPTPNTPVVPAIPTPAKSKLPMVLVSLVVLLLIGGGGIFLGTQFAKAPTPSPAPVLVTPTVPADPTANWQTYANTKYNFSFKYPLNWNIRALAGSQQSLATASDFVIEGPYSNLTSLEGTPLYNLTVSVVDKQEESTSTPTHIIKSLPIGNQFVTFEFSSSQIPPQAVTVNSDFDQILSTFKFTDSNSSKALYKNSKPFVGSLTWPKELTDLKDTDLASLACTDTFSKNADGSFAAQNSSGQSYSINEPQIHGYLNNNPTITSVMWCNDIRRIVIAEVEAGGGGSGNVVYVGYLNPLSSKLTPFASVTNNGWPYFVCNKPLALTNAGKFYIECAGGDGGFGASGVFAVDLNTGSLTKVSQCTSTSSGEENVPPKVECSN